MKINILGDGVWGLSLGKLLVKNGNEVAFWNKKDKIPPSDATLIAIPAQAIRQVIKNYGQNLAKTVIINSAKGLEKESRKLPWQIVKELLGKDIEYFTLIGPSFAQEVDRQMPTLVNLGAKNGKAKKIVKLFETDYFRVRPTKSVEALELAGALKNVYAIVCGIAEGLGFGINTRAKLITIAYEEFRELAAKLNYEIDEAARPGILGDLFLTCSSLESRNFSFGKYLVKYSVRGCFKKVNSTIEGYNTAFSVPYFSTKSQMPLGEFVLKVIKADDPKTVIKKFADLVKKI